MRADDRCRTAVSTWRSALVQARLTLRNVINVVLWGLPAVQGERSPIMPGFANMLSDQQLADLLGYVRAHFSSNKPAWTDIKKDIREARSRGPLAAPSAHGTDPANAIVSQHEAQR